MAALCTSLCYSQQIITSREQAVELIRDLRKIHTPEGIEVMEQLELNGEKQWITIRGKNKANPVLLFIHGGPASPMMPVSWAYQNPWEDYFTVVQWDQRVSGKNWSTTDTTKAVAHLRFSNIVEDGQALISYLCRKLNQEKLFVMGYSFGSKVGIQLASVMPEKIYAYIGVGQVSEGDSEKYLYERLVVLAGNSHNNEALAELKSMVPYSKPEGTTPVKDMLKARKWARYYDGGWYGKKDLNLYFSLPDLSPEYSKDEVISLAVSTPWATRKIMRQPGSFVFPRQLKVPVIFMMGRHDLHTPYQPSKNYFDNITAPLKKFYTFERSAHFPMLEEPGRFLVTLVTDVLPLAGKQISYSAK